jgi:hypothetical protein
METKGPLPYSQKQATGPYSEPDGSNTHAESLFSTDTFYIVLPSMPRSFELSLPFRLTNECFSSIYQLPLRPTCPAHRFI